MATETDRMALADEIEQATAEWPEQSVVGVYRTAAEWRTVIAALRSEAGAAMREDHRIEALKAEARDRAFRHELAESTMASAQQKWLHVGKLALAGNLEPLRRRIAYIENPPRIFGSGRSLPLQPEGGEAHGR